MGLGSDETKPEALEEMGTREAVAINLKDIAAERLEAKEKEIGEDWPLLERLVLLRTIDSVWVEHLTEVDAMRQGIGLRGFAQEDPLNAFKKEAFGLFGEMSGSSGTRSRPQSSASRSSASPRPRRPASKSVATSRTVRRAEQAARLVRASPRAPQAPRTAAAPRRRPAPCPRPSPAGRAMGGSSSATSGGSSGGAGGSLPNRPGFAPSGVRIGRNDTCWCGSGKKYKKCHGA
jgi:preprotein translocase subunit SecA